jgi:hypothetical protein
MPASVTCPHCGKGSSLPESLVGKKVRCKACEETFVAGAEPAPASDPDEEDGPARRGGGRIRTGARPARDAKPARRPDDEEYDDEYDRRRDRKRPAGKGSSAVPVLLLAGGGVALLVVVLGAAGVAWAISARRAAPAPAALVNAAPQQPAQAAQPDVKQPPAPGPDVKQPPAPKPDAKQPPPKADAGTSPNPPPAGWKRYVQPNGAYSVWLPSNGWKSDKSKTVVVEGAPVRFASMQFETREKLKLSALAVAMPLKRGQQYERSAVIDVFRDIFLKELDGAVASDSEVTLGSLDDGTLLQGKEFLIDLKSGEKARLRIFPTAKGGSVYQAMAIGTKEQVEGDDAKLFFGSFKHSGMLKVEAKKYAQDKKDAQDKKAKK